MDGGVATLNQPSKWSLANLACFEAVPLRAAGAKRDVAFGSCARGVADAWSDLDLAVVIKTDLPRPEQGRLLGELHDALPVNLDLRVLTPSEFARGVQAGHDAFRAIATEGKTIIPVGGDIR